MAEAALLFSLKLRLWKEVLHLSQIIRQKLSNWASVRPFEKHPTVLVFYL